MTVKKLRGQMTAIGLVSIFVTLIMYIALYPVLNNCINDISDIVPSDSITGMILRFVPALILLMIIMSGLAWVTPHREGGY